MPDEQALYLCWVAGIQIRIGTLSFETESDTDGIFWYWNLYLNSVWLLCHSKLVFIITGHRQESQTKTNIMVKSSLKFWMKTMKHSSHNTTTPGSNPTSTHCSRHQTKKSHNSNIHFPLHHSFPTHHLLYLYTFFCGLCACLLLYTEHCMISSCSFVTFVTSGLYQILHIVWTIF